MRNIISCQDALSVLPTLTSRVVSLTISGVAYPTWCEIVSGVGWTLLMKMDGNQQTFYYTSSYWSNTASLNPATGITGGVTDSVEYKSALYNVFPYTSLRLGMAYGGVTSWFTMTTSGTSLYANIADGVYRSTSVPTRANWFTITGGPFQPYCNMVWTCLLYTSDAADE